MEVYHGPQLYCSKAKVYKRSGSYLWRTFWFWKIPADLQQSEKVLKIATFFVSNLVGLI